MLVGRRLTVPAHSQTLKVSSKEHAASSFRPQDRFRLMAIAIRKDFFEAAPSQMTTIGSIRGHFKPATYR